MRKFRKLGLLLAFGLMLAGCGTGKTADPEPEEALVEEAVSEEKTVPEETEPVKPEPEESISERRRRPYTEKRGSRKPVISQEAIRRLRRSAISIYLSTREMPIRR